MHADNRRVDHLYGRVMGTTECIHNPAPDASPPPANEAIVAGGVRTKTVRHVPPWRPRLLHPKDAVENAAVVHPCNATRLVGQHRLDGSPLVVGKFIAHDSKLPIGELESHACGLSQCLFFYPSRPGSGPLSGRSRHDTAGKTGRSVENDPGCVLIGSDALRPCPGL